MYHLHSSLHPFGFNRGVRDLIEVGSSMRQCVNGPWLLPDKDFAKRSHLMSIL